MTYDNTNSGALFKNDKKAKDSDPMYKGSIDIEGVEYWVSSWINQSKAGQSYMSLKATKKDSAPQQNQGQQAQQSYQQQNQNNNSQHQSQQQQASQGFDDDIPF